MDETERTTLIRFLGESSGALQDAVRGVPEADAARHRPQGGWSVAEIVEHVAIAEELMLRALTERGRERPEASRDPARERAIVEAIVDRTRKSISPEVARPTGRFSSLAAAFAHFRQCRARTLEYVEQSQDDLDRRTVQHPLAGLVSGYEYLLILSRHPSRHAAQIRELRAALGF